MTDANFAVKRINYKVPNFFLLIPLSIKYAMDNFGSDEILGAALGAIGPKTKGWTGKNKP